MKKQFMPFITFITALLFIAAGCSQSPQTKETPPQMAAAASAKKDGLPNIKILATGGTIAGAAPSKTSATEYRAGAIGVDALIQAVPEIKEAAHVSGEQVVNIGARI
ncbi:hypothetical protein N786_17625 [Bacillus amyloliquefaciens UASWS BA1]|nr:hypothetical protein N786_17625 [Bacillus amyloliquefaciens UASWS BA1]